MRPRRAASLLLVAVTLVASCTAPGSTGPISTPTVGRAAAATPASATPSGADALPSCFDMPTNVDEPKSTVELSQVASHIVVASFKGYDGPARYATPDGQRVKKQDVPGNLIFIYRLAGFHVLESLRGDQTTDFLGQVNGGQIGCDKNTFDNDPNLIKGTTYLLFFLERMKPGEPPMISHAWPITNGTVRTQVEGDRTMADLKAIIAANPCTLAAECIGR